MSHDRENASVVTRPNEQPTAHQSSHICLSANINVKVTPFLKAAPPPTMPSATIQHTELPSHFIAGDSSVHEREQRQSSHIFSQCDDAAVVMDPSMGVDGFCHFFDNEEVQQGEDSGK
eukprot:scaffold106893_cov71-Cyclotella_meneghiniana.AAC.3